MLINIFLLVIIFLGLGGIFYIISRKFFSLSNIDLNRVPNERKKRIKKNLIERKVFYQIEEIKKIFQGKKVILKNFLQKFKEIINLFLNKSLIFLKNIIKYIKNKMPR